MYDFLIVGGGVIGLSVAWELSRYGKRVCVVDGTRQRNRTSSWVGAGIFPPPLPKARHDPLEQLRCLSHELHVEWSCRLLKETGIDNELRNCGGIYIARGPGETVALRMSMEEADRDGARIERLGIDDLLDREPSMAEIADAVTAAYLLPDEYQIRSPLHLAALRSACVRQSVELVENTEVTVLESSDGSTVTAVRAANKQIVAREFVLCGGPWTPKLLAPFGINLPVEPWRGQLILWKLQQPILRHVVNEGLRYLVPREDGHLIVGATVEDVGFDCENTTDAIEQLREYSCEILPSLRGAEIKQAWAALRPKTPDGVPFLGRVPGCSNLSVATGHYRSGLHLSPVTAVFMRQLLLDDTLEIDPRAFQLNR